MKFILATKKEMTRRFRPDGTVVPVTAVIAPPCQITAVKRAEKDGYEAVQLGSGTKRTLAKPQREQLKDLQPSRYLREFRVSDASGFNRGETISVKTFTPGDVINVTGISKGRGFAGVVKRHGFHGAPASHGTKDQLRMPGASGAGGPQHVFKGTRKPGRMGGTQVTVPGLQVEAIDEATNTIFITGAVPGPRNGLLVISGQGDLVIDTVVTETPAEATEPKAENAEVKAEEKAAEAPAAETVVEPTEAKQ